MSLESILTKVDEATWKQYEKVTNWAYQNYGWSKYELATMCDKAKGICFVGVGTYTALDSFNRSPMSWWGMAAGAVFSMVGVAWLNSASKDCERLERLETDLALKGTAIEPRLGIERPLRILFYSSMGLWLTIGDQTFLPKNYTGTIKEYHTIVTAVEMLYWGLTFSSISFDYFSSQIPKPPKAKKSIWQALYEPIGKYFRKAAPQLEPKPEGANNYSLTEG
ncbi:hypothetical protein HZC30_02205 [Candidatus Woesearchaeota archaeon]|nr:hypothetical protein [Candidatus Woesearchaeota archaeon]